MDSPETSSDILRSNGDDRQSRGGGSSSSDKSSRRSSSSSPSRPDGESMDSFDHQHVYANPSFDEAPEIPEVDYPISRKNSIESKSSNRSSGHPPTPITRRPSEESVIVHDPVEQPDPRFYTIPLQEYPYPPASESETVASAEEGPMENFWKFFMYGVLVLAGVTAIVLIIWASVYYSS